ncbi:MAG: hypothetical protein IPM56_08565 [Ignavibacteriales bacterium]|nr:MAG: hypothetical protein IPM56_08565 [Ignavibacteriales bacterium]
MSSIEKSDANTLILKSMLPIFISIFILIPIQLIFEINEWVIITAIILVTLLTIIRLVLTVINKQKLEKEK